MEILLKEKQQQIFKELADQRTYLQNEISKINVRENELAVSILEAHDIELVQGIRLENGRFIIPDSPVLNEHIKGFQDAEVVE